jgi:hypothetical protein
MLDAGIYLSDVASIAGSRILNITRTVKVASIGMSIDKPSTDLSRYPWGAAVDVKPVADIKTWRIKAPNINISEIQKMLSPNPGELWLEKLVLRYIHDKIKQFIAGNSAMDQCFDAFMWLLASQLPIDMGNCTEHSSAKPLLDALCDKCGSESEMVKILCNVAGYSLNASIRSIELYYLAYNGSAVNATVCMAMISSYPELWELYNTSVNSFYAKPADGGYLVLYNVYENSVFGDWRRVKEE